MWSGSYGRAFGLHEEIHKQQEAHDHRDGPHLAVALQWQKRDVLLHLGLIFN